MPRKYATAKHKVRKPFRKYGRKNRKSNYTTVVPRGRLGPVSQRSIVRMKYCTSFPIQFTTIMSQYKFNPNSIYDPDITGAGHQPYGHDTYQTLYARYRVFKMDYIIQLRSSSGSDECLAIVQARNDQDSNTNTEYVSESPGSVTKLVASSVNCTFKGSIYLPRLNGKTRAQYMADSNTQALFGANPAEAMSLNIYTKALTGSAENGGSCNVILVYHVECFDPLPLIQS